MVAEIIREKTHHHRLPFLISSKGYFICTIPVILAVTRSILIDPSGGKEEMFYLTMHSTHLI